MIPALSQWLQLALEGLAKGTAMAVNGVTAAYTKLQAYRAHHHDKSSYQGLPTSSFDLHLSPRSSSSSSSASFFSRRDPRKPISFGGKRQLKRGGVCLLSCSGRRLLQLMMLVVWVALLLVQLPQALNPFQDTLWVRYYNHEEAVKVALPLGRKVHVSDVKAAALTAISYGFGLQLGQTKLLSAVTGEALSPGAEWDNRKKMFRSSAEKPILAIEVDHSLYDFLDLQLGCFSLKRNMDTFSMKSILDKRFVPPQENWTMLVEVLELLNQNKVRKLMRAHIRYLRQGFSDPLPMGPYNMEAIYNHRKNPLSGYVVPHKDVTLDPMVSWEMQDDGGVAPTINLHWTPEDEELTREISRQEDLGNMEKAQELMDELNKKNRENGIDIDTQNGRTSRRVNVPHPTTPPPRQRRPTRSRTRPAPGPVPQPFQQPPHQNTSSQQQHYSILIPTINHWPRIALEGLTRGAVLALDALSYAQRTLHTHMNQLRVESSTSSYHVLPTSSADLHELSPASSSPSHRRRIITFGSKRQQKESGHRVQCSPRRWTRLLAALTLFVLFITLLALPRRMNLFRSRIVWVRYYSHEEPVKIVLPFGRKVHVSDVKATAVQAMAFGYDRPLGEVKLLSPHGYQKLWPGEVWDDHMETEARKPIIAVDTGLELFNFLNSNLDCLSSYPPENIRFQPVRDDWSLLYRILEAINEDSMVVMHSYESYIWYLRMGFNDPRTDEVLNDKMPFRNRQRNHMGYEHPRYAPSVAPPTSWIVPEE